MNVFSPAWFLMLIFNVALLAALSVIARKKPELSDGIMLGLYAFICVYYVLYKVYIIYFSKTYSTCLFNELPLALCQVASLMSYPAVKTRSNTLMGFSFFIGSLCSLMAIFMPSDGFYSIPLFTGEVMGFFGFHWLVFVICVSVYSMGFYKPSVKHVPRIMLLFLATTFTAHLINLLISGTVYPKANYFFTMFPENNPILDIFFGLIPVPFFYLLPLMLPVCIVMLVYAGIMEKASAKREGAEAGEFNMD